MVGNSYRFIIIADKTVGIEPEPFELGEHLIEASGEVIIHKDYFVIVIINLFLSKESCF